MSTEAHSPGTEVGMKGTKLALCCALACLMGLAAMSKAGGQSVVASSVPTAALADDAHSKLYRNAGARHLYGAYEQLIYKGPLPPLLYAIAIVETELDENGNVISAVVTREPAFAKEVGPWIVQMIRAASPFPKPGRRTRYQDIWLVDRSYTFQLDTLTEGQL
jgi:periplasmic protein TonB